MTPAVDSTTFLMLASADQEDAASAYRNMVNFENRITHIVLYYLFYNNPTKTMSKKDQRAIAWSVSAQRVQEILSMR